jgi:hypothetical protein
VLLFALEIVVNKRDSTGKKKNNGDILLNPGNYKLPKPFSKNNKYTYYGYFIADDYKEAVAVFEREYNNDQANESKELQSIDSIDRDYIAAEFHRFEGEEDDVNIEMENIEGGDWFNLQQSVAKPVNKEDIIFDTMENSKLAENHIIICGMVENIWHFVMPLRAEHCAVQYPIVILNEELPTAKQWQQLSYFSQIYFVQGSPLMEKSYERVNIMKAKQVVILTANLSA